MAKKERIREALTGLPSREYLMERVALGWRPAAIEWEREIVPEGAPEPYAEEIPYGLRVAADCGGLVEDPQESEIITLALDMIVQDCPLSHVAAEINKRGFKTRAGKAWTPSDLFTLLPRMIQVGPRLFSSEQWTTRRERLPRVV
jgi:hypothetical protein